MTFRKFGALLVGWEVFLLTALNANALQCYNCYSVETPSNWEHNESVTLLPFDFTCGIASKPNPKLLVDCDEWAKGQAVNNTKLDETTNNNSTSSQLQNLFASENPDAGNIPWTCATFSFDGKMKKGSYDTRQFKGTYRTCFLLGNIKEIECNRGELEGLGDRFEGIPMKLFMKSLSGYFTQDTETVACTCFEDACNKDVLEDPGDVSIASIIYGFDFVLCFFGVICFQMISKIL
ncbi:unnamed protein product [Orchesella dallaii]|uniref:Protein sleepless n=1 Tax=Orchesella dallaii TaxID=48710 RepID=A0ABP1PVB0_9HEXA